MMPFSNTEAVVPAVAAVPNEKLQARCSEGELLRNVTVLVITSGHEATDHRVYGKHALGVRQLGADVTVVGALEHRVPGNVPVVAVPKPRSRLARFLWQPWRCLWAARKAHADIIHFHDPEMLATLPLAKLWWRKARFVYDVHEDFANLMLIRDWLPAWIKPIVKMLTDGVEKSLALLADGIVGVTPPLAEKFRNRERIVAYNYVARGFFEDAAKLRVEPSKREFDLVHLGTLNLRRARFLAGVLREFHRLKPAARSLVIGVSPDIERSLSDELPDECTVKGKVPHEQIPGLLANSKVGLDVHPWLGVHLEVALPVKVCEYMAAGCAVVSSTMPVLKRVLDEAQVGADDLCVIDGGLPADYARAAVRLLNSIDEGHDPGARLQKSAGIHMVWENEATKIGRLYLRLLGRPCVT